MLGRTIHSKDVVQPQEEKARSATTGSTFRFSARFRGVDQAICMTGMGAEPLQADAAEWLVWGFDVGPLYARLGSEAAHPLPAMRRLRPSYLRRIW